MSKKIKERALEIIELEIKKKNYDSLEFLNFLTTYLSNKQVSIKDYIRLIKKSIKYLEKHFDETYLLLFNTKNKYKLFNEFENRNFLNYIDDLITILSENDYIKEADKLTTLKGKVELGYTRYFIIDKNTKVYGFSPETKEYSLYEKFDIKTEIDFREILFHILELKETKNKNYKKTQKEFEKYFSDFPRYIYKTKSKNWLNIEKSLFPNETLDVKELNDKENTILKDLNNPEIANLILKIL